MKIGNPQKRIELMREMGAIVTPEMEEREYRITLSTVAQMYGSDWEQNADAVRTHIEALDTGDWLHEALAADADDVDNRRTMHEAAM